MDRETKLTLQSINIKTDEELQKKDGINFFYKFFQLIKNAHFHNINNKALMVPITNFIELANEIISRENGAILQYKDNSLFFNKNRIRFTSEEFDYAKYIFNFLEKRNIGKIGFFKALNEEDIFKFLSIFVYSKDLRYEDLESKIKEQKLPISIEKIQKGEGGVKKLDLDKRLYVLITYSKAIVLYENFLDENLSQSKRDFIIIKLSRIVQNFIDICKEDDNTFLGLSQIKNPTFPFSNHIINVLILSISLGEKIGLSKNQLFYLGLSSLFYDIGMSEISKEVLKKEKGLTPKEGIDIKNHPFYSFNKIISIKKLDIQNIYKAIVSFEHHISSNKEHSYPSQWEEPHLFSKIINICDTYDSLTTSKPYRPAYLPDEALSILIENSSHYDLPLLKVFINTIGFYPSGSFVILNTNEKALVLIGGGSKERILNPIVEILNKGEVVDLLKDSEKRRIISSIPPYEAEKSYGSLLLGG